MKDTEYQTADLTIFRNKTGKYVGRIVEVRPPDKAVVEVLAVLTHPTQGDLHQPMQSDVPLFHQRRAMSFREKTVVQTRMLTDFEGKVPDYKASLREAMSKKMETLKENSDDWSIASVKQLEDLEKDYFE